MPKIRPDTNFRSNPIPVDQEYEAVIILAYAINEEGDPAPVGSFAVEPEPKRSILDYSGRLDGNPVYVGSNTQDAVIADPDWVVLKLFYDATNRLIDKQVLTGSWTDRAALPWRTPAGN